MIIKTGEKVNVAVRGGLTGNVVGVENSKNGTLYTVEVEGYEENFIIPDRMVAKYGVGQGVMFLSSPKESWGSKGKIKEIKYNTTTHKVEYSIWHEACERFSSLPTPRVTVVSEDYVLESTEYKPFELTWMCD